MSNLRIPLKRASQALLFSFLYFFLPVYLSIYIWHLVFPLFLFYLLNGLGIFFVFKRHINKKGLLKYQLQRLEEEINILNTQISQETKNRLAQEAKRARYMSLKKIVEDINLHFDMESVADSLTSIAFSTLSDNKGACLLYLVDNLTQQLRLFKARKEDSSLIIKEKESDIFDSWVIRHTSSLFIEDAKNDFRFDLEKLKPEDSRPIRSLISSCLISETNFLGILRLENPAPSFYTQDDLRFLTTFSDLGAVALENAQLFEKVQYLAIHDELTSLYTKGYFLERIKQECNNAIRQKTKFCLAMLDVDFFKDYNDKFGHIAGDMVLKKVSLTIVESLKGLNVVCCRFGGEEFCIIMLGINKEKANHILNDLREDIRKEEVVLRRQKIAITVSIGIASFPEDAKDAQNLIQKADNAMYQAKQKGRDQICS